MLPLNWYPPFRAVLLGLAVLFLRVHDRNAWLFALVFAGLGVGPQQAVETVCHPAVRNFVLAYSALFGGMLQPCSMPCWRVPGIVLRRSPGAVAEGGPARRRGPLLRASRRLILTTEARGRRSGS